MWRDGNPFAITFPRFFRLSKVHNALISDVYFFVLTGIFPLKEIQNDRQTEDLSSLLDVLGNFCTTPSKKIMKFDIQFFYHTNLLFSSLLDVLRNYEIFVLIKCFRKFLTTKR